MDDLSRIEMEIAQIIQNHAQNSQYCAFRALWIYFGSLFPAFLRIPERHRIHSAWKGNSARSPR